MHPVKPSPWKYATLTSLMAAACWICGPVMAQHVSDAVMTASPSWDTVKPGAQHSLHLHLIANSPALTRPSLKVRLVDAQGKVLDESSQHPTIPGARWTAGQTVTVPVSVPPQLAEGSYDIQVSVADSTHPSTAPQTVAHVNVTHRVLRNAPLKCNGNDETAELKAAISSLKPGETLKLPPGQCRFSQDLYLSHKKDVELVGSGMDDTVLLTSVPFKSAIIVVNSENITVRDLTVQLDKDFGRYPGGHSRGLYAEKSSGVRIVRTRHLNMAGAGIAFFIMRNSVIQDNEVIDSAADGIHVTGGCQDIVVDGNLAVNTGDDSFSSIGYDSELNTIGPNQRIRISNNRSFYSHASGVAVEGTKNIVVSGNVIESSGVAGIRVASIDNQDPGQITGAVDNARITGNTIRYARTRTEVDHAAIMVFADYRDLTNISIEGNRIEEPQSADAIVVRGLSGTPPRRIVGATIRGNTVTGPSTRLRECLHTNKWVDALVVSGNSWSKSTCP